jgi:hypothetical protein
LGPAERIPWTWITSAIPQNTRIPRQYHVLVAQRDTATDVGPVYGFVVGMRMQKGGYLSYVAVDPRARGRGVGAMLYRGLIRKLRRSAHAAGREFPFLLWDSRPPSPADGPEVRDNWTSRLALFKKIGGYWIDGVQFTSPNWLNPRAGDVPLEFFLRPVDDDRADFNEGRLRRIVRGLLKNIYHLDMDGPDGECLREYATLRLAPIRV